MPSLSLAQVNRRVVRCCRCPTLREYCAEVGRAKRKAFKDWTYWAKPVPGFGDVRARLMIVGLAPAAHGANRTGRMFTGDRSGDFLYAALHRAGLANQPTSVARDDGLELRGVYITASLRCAPPANKPTAEQLQQCRVHLIDDIAALQPRVLLCLGGIAWNATLATLAEMGIAIPRPKPRFGHGAHVEIGGFDMVGCYHVSQQNTFTGRLTEAMLDDVVEQVSDLLGGAAGF